MELPIQTMSIAQKLDAMEQLWTSLRSSPDYNPPSWHGEILAERRRKIECGEATFTTLDEVLNRIHQARS